MYNLKKKFVLNNLISYKKYFIMHKFKNLLVILIKVLRLIFKFYGLKRTAGLKTLNNPL